ncbi:hypothetical protein Q1695_011522 [Nippostrongylus brasiliensis]|nr:hypothetical protein Q1695_011522 [Nippostrongylus brasiliensis]
MTSRAEAQDLTSEGFQSASSCLTASEEDDVKDSRRKSELRPSNELAERRDGSDTECGEQDPSANSRDDGQRGKRRSVNIRPIATSSMEIDVFVNADISAGKQFAEYRRKGDSRHVDDLLHNNVSTFFSGATLSSGALSVLVDLYEFPPKLRSRQPNVLLRPVVIDGCAVSGCFDKDFSANWGRMKTVSWTTCKVLSMRPIYDCVMEFLLRGHKVTVVLPSFYQNVTDTLLRCKVDDPEALDVLVNLKIVKFINRAGGASVIDVIKDEVDEVDALLVSSACYDSKGDWQYAPNAAFSAQAEVCLDIFLHVFLLFMFIISDWVEETLPE